MPSICIQNLGKYNEGELLFEWVDLPVSDEELNAVLNRIKICNNGNNYYDDCGNPYEEIMLADWEDFGAYPVSEWSNIRTLNEVAAFLEELSSEESEAFEYFIGNGYSLEDAKYKVKNHEYTYLQAENDTDLAYTYIEEVYGGIEYASRSLLERHFDYESYGEELSYDYQQTTHGYIAA